MPIYLSWPSHYSVEKQRCCYHESQKTSANSLTFEDNPSDESLRYIKNNNGPSMDPWGTPALTSDQLETCPFNRTLCFLFLK